MLPAKAKAAAAANKFEINFCQVKVRVPNAVFLIPIQQMSDIINLFRANSCWLAFSNLPTKQKNIYLFLPPADAVQPCRIGKWKKSYKQKLKKLVTSGAPGI